MVKSYKIEFAVGMFVVISVLAVAMLALKVSGLSSYKNSKQSYSVVFEFTNIGSLKPKAKVTLAGVVVGRVLQISLDPKSYNAKVLVAMQSEHNIPDDTTASILTAGLLGDNYIGLTPGFSDSYLKANSFVSMENTHSALVLEKLIDKFIANQSSR